MTNHPELYGHLLDNAVTTWAEDCRWMPGKWATVSVLRGIARDKGYHALVSERVRNANAAALADEDPVPGPVLTLRDLVAMAFEIVLLVYGPRLPLGGYWVRAAMEFVLQHLDRLFPPRGLVFKGP